MARQQREQIGADIDLESGQAGLVENLAEFDRGPSRLGAGGAAKISSRSQGSEASGVAALDTARTRSGSAGAAKVGAANAEPNFAENWTRIQRRLRVKHGEDVYTNWFGSLELDDASGETAYLTVATRFLKNWIQSHYGDGLLAACRSEFKHVKAVEVGVRQPGMTGHGGKMQQPQAQADALEALNAHISATESVAAAPRIAIVRNHADVHATEGGGFQGSPLDRRLTFDSYVVGMANRLAHAAARQAAETYMEQPLRFNPLYIHGGVGLGKSHLLHAIAWQVKERNPNAQVLYLTAERFRYRFVAALKSQDAMSFKERLRGIDILLIDDMEFLQGEKTEQEFDHTLNSLLDGGKQVVVASARAPSQLDKLDMRMRSRLSGGLVTEITSLDHDLRLKILGQRAAEKQAIDPSFVVPTNVLDFLADRLTESGRELDGAITRLHASSQLTRTSITLETAEDIIRDLVRGVEPKRIKIEDIIRVVSKHFGVTRNDILSERRHRAVVWPRQIGMFLAKNLTARSLPDIGQRFGGRDHTTVLHAIRKVQALLEKDSRLRDEIEDLKRLLNN